MTGHKGRGRALPLWRGRGAVLALLLALPPGMLAAQAGAGIRLNLSEIMGGKGEGRKTGKSVGIEPPIIQSSPTPKYPSSC
jgi:hypothetical protein